MYTLSKLSFYLFSESFVFWTQKTALLFFYWYVSLYLFLQSIQKEKKKIIFSSFLNGQKIISKDI